MKIKNCILIVVICLYPIFKGQAQAGFLDPTFGTGGKVTTDAWTFDDYGFSTVIQNDGKIVVAGYSLDSAGFQYDFAVIRYNSDGTLDTAFGTAGIVTTPIGNYLDEAFSVALQADGKIVLGGVTDDTNPGTDNDFAAIRYNSDGSLDTSFGTGGIVTTDFGSVNGHSVAIQDDGKIVLAGESYNGTNTDFAAVRYHADGSIDTSFGSGGIVTTSVGTSDDYLQSISIQDDDKILLAGWGVYGPGNVFLIVRYSSDGSVDTTFGTGGIATASVGNTDSRCFSIGLQADGKIVAAGFHNNGTDHDFALMRFNSDGLLDTSFGTGGIVTTPIGNGDDRGYAITIQANGKIIVTGSSNNGSDFDFTLVRYNSDGTLDNSFGTGGKTLTDFGGVHDFGFAAALQTDGKIIVAGTSNNDFAIARYDAGTVSIAENANEENTITIFPNPSTNEFFLEGTKENREVIIFDMMGEKVLWQKTFAPGTKVDIAHLVPGFYLLNYIDGYKTANIKLIKL